MRHTNKLIASILCFGLVLFTNMISAEISPHSSHMSRMTKLPPIPVPSSQSFANAVLSPIKNSGVQGIITFTPVKNGVKVSANISGLTPGKHGFHIHEFGDISTPDGSGAGGHYNPSQSKHGSPDEHDRHGGDLGNLFADQNGDANLEYIDSHIQLSGENSIIGRSIIVHEKEDDLETQPTGGAGARIAQGVIGISQGGLHK